MLLHQLFREYDPSLDLQDVADVEIRGICEDSRLARPGDLFVARNGTRTDGLKFVKDATARGAVAVVGSTRIGDCWQPQVPLDNLSRAASELAHIFYGRPTARLRVLGITGTNGKTTTVYLLRHLLGKYKQTCGMIGTVEIDDGKIPREAMMTTPGPIEIAQLMRDMCNNGCKACAMEVSSHALDQNRVSGIAFAGSAFTNLTGDHLDYHGNMERYAEAKAKLFVMLNQDSVAVVNGDDPASERMIARCRGRILRFGFGENADYRAVDVASSGQGSKFILQTPRGKTPTTVGLIDKHNIANILTASALAGEVFDLDADQIAEGLADASGAPGRLQSVRAGQSFPVLVDYAHTDDALENVLMALRPLAKGKLRVLFGCGGDRDRTKRPRMARVAARLADVVYITSDNPRTENPQAILDEIVQGLPKSVSIPVVVEPDRRMAIGKILSDASREDVVLLAGKGHENYQIIGTTKHHFDDVEEAGRILSGGARAA